MNRPFTTSAPLYTFLAYCNESPLPKEILDCGAGGASPPLALFFESGYRTHGIEISDDQLAKAESFCAEHDMNLDIAKGDMRKLPFADESMSFVYSYASICHMTKSDVAIAVREMTRVLKKGGLCFVSFCATPDRALAGTEPMAPGEYPHEVDGEAGVHSIFADTEPEHYFRPFVFVQKEKRQIEHFAKHDGYGWAELLYFARKL